MDAATVKDSVVQFQTSSGVEVRATLLRLTRHLSVFEVYNLGNNLRTSEVLADFRIVLQDRMVYSGKAIIKSLVDTGLMTICEVQLDDSWADVDLSLSGAKLREEFRRLIDDWGRSYSIMPEYKVVAADIQMFLTELRLWMEQVELGVRASPSEDRLQLERRIGDELQESFFPTLDSLFGKLEKITSAVEADRRPAHCTYIRRQIHPLTLCSPFAFRTVHKPLGFAGDYETVNMLLRDPHEGGSLYAKVLNRWFIKQPPAEAHRNRIAYITRKLLEETLRLTSQGKVARVFNLGCGPAREVQNFISTQTVSGQTHFTLVDFNEETLLHAKAILDDLKARYHRPTPMQFVKKSVAHILRGKAKTSEGAPDSKYDFVYCAGLFDYLPDASCRQLMNIFYDMLAPGGLLLATNVDVCNPIRHWLSDVLEWHLIYRTGQQMLSLCPERANPDLARVQADITGVNLFLEIRRAVA